jgi:DNA (cytosine-5)-methyltransferase 1
VKFLSLFAGIGGIDLGLERAGMTCRGQCEIDAYGRAILARHWPDVWRWDDVRTLNGSLIREHCGPIELIAGGFPYQDISNFGYRVGIDGARSGLWRDFHRLIGEVRPRFALMENVAALLERGMGRVLGDLAEIGFDAEWRVLDARFFGVPQVRRRVFILAYPAGSRVEPILDSDAVDVERGAAGVDATRNRPADAHDQAGQPCPLSLHPDAVRTALLDDRRSRMDGRISDWVAGYKGIGNSVVPQVAEYIGRLILAAERRIGGAA